MKKIYVCLGAFMFSGMLFAQKPETTVSQRMSAITIDGANTDAAWADAENLSLTKLYKAEVSDNAFDFQLLYDADNVYIFVDVTDANVTADLTADWLGDKVEIYFGLPGYTIGQSANEEFGRQFYIVANLDWIEDEAKPAHWVELTKPAPAWWPTIKTRGEDGVEFAYVETVGGYAFEMKINKIALDSVDFTTIDSLGFDITLADNDVTTGAGVRNRLVWYNDGTTPVADENWSSLDLGTITFETFDPLSTKANKASNQSAYISNNMLQFKGFNTAVNVEVYSILGSKVISAKNVKEVNVAGLTKGAYLVRVGNQSFKVVK